MDGVRVHIVAADLDLAVEGVAEREPLIQANPQDPRNRRISILLMR